MKQSRAAASVSYAAPTKYLGPIELQIVVNNLATDDSKGIIASTTSLQDLPNRFNNVQAVVTLLSQVQNGQYSISAIIKPSGAKFSERFECFTPGLEVGLITEYVDFTDNGLVRVEATIW